jgi:hypothetical protein
MGKTSKSSGRKVRIIARDSRFRGEVGELIVGNPRLVRLHKWPQAMQFHPREYELIEDEGKG